MPLEGVNTVTRSFRQTSPRGNFHSPFHSYELDSASTRSELRRSPPREQYDEPYDPSF